MNLDFYKMQGAGNDFVVIDLTRTSKNFGAKLTTKQYQLIADRNFGIGADQILLIEDAPDANTDFFYRIINSDGSEVENCGNGVRCLMRYVLDAGLTTKKQIIVKTITTEMLLQQTNDGRIRVDMGAPIFEHEKIPFDATNLSSRLKHQAILWQLPEVPHELVVVSMGNPHAVLQFQNINLIDVANLSKNIQQHPSFPAQVNVGFMQIIDRNSIKLRVHERGSGETLACGTGACAAVVAGMLLGELDDKVDVHTSGGLLTIEWQTKQPTSSVFMTGPASIVFQGKIQLPDKI